MFKKIRKIPVEQIVKLGLQSIVFLPFLPLALLIWLIRPWLVIRMGSLYTSRIGHFAGNTELYLCEKEAGINVPKKKFIDLFFVTEEICNQQLFKMWKRKVTVCPAFILYPVYILTYLLPKGKTHRIGKPIQHDRDILHLMKEYPAHLEFTEEEEAYGNSQLPAIGINNKAPFVCLIVRDSAYLPESTYHNYRNCDIDNYVLAAEDLTRRGYYVVRMGAKVNKRMQSNNPMIIDYASDGIRSDFMDIYLGAKCTFCISTSTGWDAIPYVFRKPIVFAPIVPVGYMFTFSENFIAITKHIYNKTTKKELGFLEIFSNGIGYMANSSEYENSNIDLIENTPEEIREVAAEMDDRLKGTWLPHEEDAELQERFWKIYQVGTDIVNGRPLHGALLARFGASFLRANCELLK
jgi:putative glycosyltransferase (TIGR04372 family)